MFPITCKIKNFGALNLYNLKQHLSDIFNSSPPSATYMRQWIGSALVQIMVCRLFGAKLGYCQLDFGNIFQLNLNMNSIVFIQENANEDVVCQNGCHFVQGEMSCIHEGFWWPMALGFGLPVPMCPCVLWQQNKEDWLLIVILTWL